MSERTLLDRLLEPGALSVVFQPVFELDGAVTRIHYVEALIRGPEGTSVASPDILFEYARRMHRVSEMDRACVSAIFGAARCLPEETHIGVNIHASSLATDPEFLNHVGDAASVHGIRPGRLVVVIVEHAPPWDVESFRTGIAGLRDIGARIALDDVGLGHSNYKMILVCRPDYFKIDRFFVAGSSGDFYRRAVLASVAQLAQPFGAQVVAEGIENASDLTTVREAGIRLVQGWLLATPSPAHQLTGALRAHPQGDRHC